MINIFLKCSDEIKPILQTYFKAHAIPISSSCDSSSIIIEQVTSKSQPTSNNQFIFIVDQSTAIFELLSKKPLGLLRLEHLEEDLAMVEKWLDIRKPLLEFHACGTNLLLNPENIIYIESYLHYLYIHTSNGKFKIRKKLSEILTELKPYHFIQIHRSYIVNEQYIEAISKECLLNNGLSLPIGAKYSKANAS